MTPLEWFLSALPDAKRSGQGWIARCPAHDDRRASLSFTVGEDRRILVKCFAGCEFSAIRDAMQSREPNLIATAEVWRNQTPRWQGGGRSPDERASRMIARYDYHDEVGTLVMQVVRFEPKDFRQRQPDGQGGWKWSIRGVRVLPYRLPNLLNDPDCPVVIVEGEKDCDTLARLDVVATCNAGGAGKWTTEHAAFLRNRRVLVLPDNDDAGRRHAQQVAQTLDGIAESVRIVDLPGLPAKGDVSDWIAAGGDRETLYELAETAPLWTPATSLPWPDLVCFDVLDLPGFPTHVLPDDLRDWVESQSYATQTPADLSALLALAVCAACLARRVVVEPRPGWREPVNLFVAVLLEPANRKSAVFAEAVAPLREIEAERIEASRSAVASAQSERRQDEARLRKLEKLAAERLGDEAQQARLEAAELAVRLADTPEPALPRLLVDDATSEKLGMMLSEQGGRIASMSPEGGVFDLMAGQYSRSSTPQFNLYLQGHSGDDVVTDRVGRASVRVERPALTCAYAIQPQVIQGVAENPAFRGRGLLARFLYAAPQSWIGRRAIGTTPVSESTRMAYRTLVRRLANREGETVLQLTAAATERFRDWESEIEAMLGDGGSLERLRDWGGKLAGATLRLAAVLHGVASDATGPIGALTVEAAIVIARALIPHAEATLNLMAAREDTTEADARYVLRWIERHGRQKFTKREAQQHGKRRFPKADDIDPALAELTRRGYIRPMPSRATGPGRPSSPTFEVHPKMGDTARPRERSHNSHNLSNQATDEPFENIESATTPGETSSRVRVTL